MAFSLFLAMALHQDPNAQAAVVPPFQAPFVVSEANRLAINPKLDGVLSDEEWDSLSSGPELKSYFQWEPGRLFFGAEVNRGKTVAISLDLGANGWLVGSDNYEIRVTPGEAGAAPTLTSRRLDASNVAGPTWVDFPLLAKYAKVASQNTASGTVYEISITDPALDLFPNDDRSGMAIRVDALDSATAGNEPFLPRALAPIKFVFQRAAALAPGLRWNVEGAGDSVVPGITDRLRFTFNGDAKVKPTRVTLRSEGPLRNRTTQLMRPFPNFDRKGRAFVDYDNPIADDADAGWQVVRAAVESQDGISGLVQASFRVAPLLDVVLIKQQLKSSTSVQNVRMAYFVRSNSPKRVDGVVAISPTGDLRVINGNEKKFVISSVRSSVRRVMEVEIPANAKGNFPIDFVLDLGDKKLTQRAYVNVN